MNLKDRMHSGSLVSVPAETENEPKKNSNSSDTAKNLNPQPQDSILQKQSEMIQTLLSEKSELTSVIADLRAELSSVQKINQSLTTNNQLLVKQNDDLRNNAGLLSRKEQEKLEKELTDTQARLSDAGKKINMSSVKAVQDAQAAQRAAERKADNDILEYKKFADKRIYDAVNDRNTAIRKAKEALKTAGKEQSIAWGSLLMTLMCCLIAYQTFLWDVWYFISVPISWLWDRLTVYSAWLDKPYYIETISGIDKKYAFSTGWAWTLRILSIVLIFACTAGICYGIYSLFMYYRIRWCNLSLKVLLASLAAIIIFGEGIRKYVSINLVLLFVIIQLIYLGVLVYFDGYFESRYRTDDWEKILNS